MKIPVPCWAAGKDFTVDCSAVNDAETCDVAKAQYPNARIHSVEAVSQ